VRFDVTVLRRAIGAAGAAAGLTMLRHADWPSDVISRADANRHSRKQNARRSAA
jgi:hypothetical protein